MECWKGMVKSNVETILSYWNKKIENQRKRTWRIFKKKLRNVVPLPSSPTRRGKTTITEQLLYFGGEIREAGTVKGKKTGTLPSLTGWISRSNAGFRWLHLLCSLTTMVASTSQITPGHEDFSEDTYRTFDGGGCCCYGRGLCQGYRGLGTKKLFEVVNTVAFRSHLYEQVRPWWTWATGPSCKN